MNIEVSFSPYILAFGFLGVLLLLGIYLRAKVSFFQRFLIPACLIGGIAGFILVNFGFVQIESRVFSLIAFHFFNLSNISIGLTISSKFIENKKTVLKGALWMSAIFTIILCVQSFFGFTALFMHNLFFDKIYMGLGLLVGHGFTQGPGQSLAITSIWERSYNIKDAIDVGLAFATIGYFASLFIGIPLINWGIRKGLTRRKNINISKQIRRGIMDRESKKSMGRETTHPNSIDTLATHLALMGAVYLLSYLLCYFLKYYVVEGFWEDFTFNFIYIYGLGLAVLARYAMIKLKKDHLINLDFQKGITGSIVDFLLISTIVGIEMMVVLKYLFPIIVISLGAVVLTVLVVVYFGQRIGGSYDFERAIILFGSVTGSLATGLLLLRIIDPRFKTATILEVNVMNIFLSLTIPLIVLTVTAFPGMESALNLMFVYFGTVVFSLFVLKMFKLWTHPDSS